MSPMNVETNRLFTDINKKYEEWHKATYYVKNLKAPQIKPPLDPTPEGLEKEIWVKASLLADGLRFDDSALEGICDVYREQSRWLFDWNISEHRYYLPEELLLPMDSVVQVRENSDSRWMCTVEDGAMVLKRDGKFVIECRHIPRPKYYSMEASPGIIMRRIAPKRGQDCLVLNYAPFCMYWTTDDGCQFCNIVPNMRWTKDDLQVTKRSFDQILKTTKAAFDEGCLKHILLTGGYLSKHKKKTGEEIDREDKMILDIIHAQQEALKRDDIPVNVIRTAPEDKDLKSIEEHKKKGAYSVAYNLEVWDPTLFKKYCPGKDKVQGRDHWLRALEVAAEVYGPGRVSTHFVTGFIEPEESLLEGIEWCSERGIGSIPLVWSPVKGTKYDGFRAPQAEWFVEMVKKIADIRLKHGVDAFEPAALPNDCYLCAMPSLIADELRLRRVKRELEEKKK
ncbi:MAG: radical SAM protein [Candidatus Aminicenantes bacterium]|nr:MAG: radical SAM protein [Candidatus Aminicenantes bacterium]